MLVAQKILTNDLQSIKQEKVVYLQRNIYRLNWSILKSFRELTRLFFVNIKSKVGIEKRRKL